MGLFSGSIAYTCLMSDSTYSLLLVLHILYMRALLLCMSVPSYSSELVHFLVMIRTCENGQAGIPTLKLLWLSRIPMMDELAVDISHLLVRNRTIFSRSVNHAYSPRKRNISFPAGTDTRRNSVSRRSPIPPPTPFRTSLSDGRPRSAVRSKSTLGVKRRERNHVV